MATFDVTVMGAGVFGLSIAYCCARKGARVQVIDPAGVASGASGGLVGALSPHVPEQWNEKKAFQLESLLAARSFWPDVERVSGLITGYRQSGRVQPLADAAAVALARSRAEGAERYWRGEAVWEVVEAVPSPLMPASATGFVVSDTLSALIHPRQATLALAAAVQALDGVVLREGDATGRVVWATGWEGLEEMTAQHHRQVGNGVKGQAALFRLEVRAAAQHRERPPRLVLETFYRIAAQPHRFEAFAECFAAERIKNNISLALYHRARHD